MFSLLPIVILTTSCRSSKEPVTEADFVKNTPPLLEEISISPAGEIYNDMTLTCGVTVVDPDEVIEADFKWEINGTSAGEGSMLDLNEAGVVPLDNITCIASAMDSEGASATDSITIGFSIQLVPRYWKLYDTRARPQTGRIGKYREI